MINVDKIRETAAGFIEGHADDLVSFLVRAAVAWVRAPREAEAAIERVRTEYENEFAETERRMRARDGVVP